MSSNPNYVEGLGTYNRLLQASNDWTITIQSHISAFTNNQTNPYYSAGISLIQTTSNGLIYPNRVDLNLVRTGVTGASLSNSIISSLYINNGETDTAANKNLTNVYLQLRFTAANKSIVSAYSTNGSKFTTIQSYNLVSGWKIKATDQLTLGVAANDQPDGRVIPNYDVLPGMIYLNNLSVVSANAPTNIPTNNTSGGTFGGTLSLGAGSLNTYSGGLTMSNGALTVSGGATMIGGSNSVSFGDGSLQQGNGTVVLNSNNMIGSSSNSTSGTNVLGGGTGTINLTNSVGTLPDTGAMTNSNTFSGGIEAGGVVLPPGFVPGGLVTNSNATF